MNQDQWLSLLRTLLAFGGGMVVTKGWVDNTTMLTITAGIVAAVTAVWGTFGHSDTAKVTAATDLVKKLPADHETVQPLVDAVALKEDQGLAKETTPSPIPGYGKRSY